MSQPKAVNPSSPVVVVENKPRGLNVVTWSRDCDCAEVTRLERVKNGKAFRKAYRSMAQNAEGPFSMRIVSDEEAAELSLELPTFWDRAAEQMGY